MQRIRTGLSRRFLTITIGAALLIVVLPSFLVYREMRVSTLNRALIMAIRDDNDADILALLRDGADGTACEDNGSSSVGDLLRRCIGRFHPNNASTNNSQDARVDALMLYYREPPPHSEQVALALLNTGAAYEHVDVEGNSPLEYAVRARHHAVVLRLIELGANVNVKLSMGVTVLMGADAEDARILLDHGAEIEKTDIAHETALFGADPDTTELLLSRGANIEAVRDSDRQTPFICACAYGQDDQARILLRHHASLSALDSLGATAFLRATSACRLETVQALVDADADIHVRDNNGTSGLMASLDNKDARVFHWLLNRGGDINAVGFGGNTALSIAEMMQTPNNKRHPNVHLQYVRAVQILKRMGAREVKPAKVWKPYARQS